MKTIYLLFIIYIIFYLSNQIHSYKTSNHLKIENDIKIEKEDININNSHFKNASIGYWYRNKFIFY